MLCQRRSFRYHPEGEMSSEFSIAPSLPPIITFLTPQERPGVDAIGEGYYHAIHKENIEEVIRDVKSRSVHAILVSVTCAGAYVDRVATLVREFPRIPAVALLSEVEAKTPQAVLALGHSGIRRIVDVRAVTGWRELRGALLANAGSAGQRGLLSQLAIDLAGVSEDCWMFFETLFSCDARIGNVRTLCRQLRVHPSTIMSRFFRAGVPAPKRYLAMSRLVRAALIFENPGYSIANVANHMDYSSPQSFGRHVRALLQLNASQFRAHYDGMGMFERFRHELILPYRRQLSELRPLTTPVGWLRSSAATRQLIH